MSDDMSNPARRAARIKMRENAERLTNPRRTMMDTSSAAFEALAARQEREQHARTSPTSSLDQHYREHGRLLTGTEPAEAKEHARLKQQASEFQYSPEKELMLQWEKAGDPKFDRLDPQQRMALGFYRRSKQAARELGLPTGKPKDDGYDQ
jgi:hypothetical protein